MKRRLCIVAALLLTGTVLYWNGSQGVWYLRSTHPNGEASYFHAPNGPIDEPHCREFITGLESWRSWAPAPDDPGRKTQYACTRVTPLAAWMGSYVNEATKMSITPPWETAYISGAWAVIVLALLWPLRGQSLSVVPEDEAEPEHGESAPTRRAGFEASDTWSRPYSGQPALMFRRGRRLS
jgi:hypothetical protein